MKKGNASKPSKRQLVLHKLEALAQSTTHEPEAQTARARAEELKIHHEIVQVAPATEHDPGSVTEGHWFLEGDAVVICDNNGEPKHHRDIANRIVPLPDQTPRQVARRLIREMHRGARMTKQYAMTRQVAALCRREDYERYKAIMDDGARAPATFDAYEANFKAGVAQVEAELGGKVEVLEFDPDEFVRFCEKHKLKRDSFARSSYASVKVTGDLERDFKFVTRSS
jgi:hypothetical protein